MTGIDFTIVIVTFLADEAVFVLTRVCVIVLRDEGIRLMAIFCKVHLAEAIPHLRTTASGPGRIPVDIGDALVVRVIWSVVPHFEKCLPTIPIGL
jgi:hypothetical protein